jgi:hypothetical protein
MQYDINEGNFLTFKDDEIITPSDPDSDIPDNTEETGFNYNNYGSTMYATSEDEPEDTYSDEDLNNDQDEDLDYSEDSSGCCCGGPDEDYSSEDDSDSGYDDSEEYEDDFIEL